LNAEIANGRLAMTAIFGMVMQDGVTGGTGPQMWIPSGAFEDELGVQAPVGFWDPVGYCADGNMENFKRRRSTEIKHGRVSMYACLGYIVPEYVKWPGVLSPSAGLKFADIPNGLKALYAVPGAGWFQMIAFVGAYEIYLGEDSEEPGNYGKGGLGAGWAMADPETRKRKLNAELANGRLAMMAIIGMFYQDGLTGSAWGDWAQYTDSPLRAFESELGVQAPTGFWDPAGFVMDGDEENFKRMRSAEIKHGRVSMFATIGYMMPEYVKLPGYLSPSTKLAFADIPNGLGAISKVPNGGWVQITLLCALIEFGYGGKYGLKEWKEGQPGDYGLGFLGLFGPVMDPEKKKRSLNAEIANGRLAMTAILGMVMQDGVTGGTGPQMWIPSSAQKQDC